MDLHHDIIIIGAGPAGLMAAISAAQAGGEVLLIEANNEPGRKLLKTGGGRCNITHTGDIDEFIAAYEPFGRFLRHSLHHFSPKNTLEFFYSQGLQTQADTSGCVFPVSGRTTDVANTLVHLARHHGVKILNSTKVNEVCGKGGEFEVITPKYKFKSRSVIIACGGISWPQTGSTGDGYKFARIFGHKIVKPTACLVPLITQQAWPGTLAGLSVGPITITAEDNEKKINVKDSLLFTHDGIGGPASLEMSRKLANKFAAGSESVRIYIDLLCEYDRQRLEQVIIEKCSENPRKELLNIVDRLIPRALALTVCRQLAGGQSRDICGANLSRESRKKLIELLKNMPLDIIGPAPIEEATVTRGGVDLTEIDDKTMQSRLITGLYFSGEVIDADGPCGGYNLQIAWSTGALAGDCAARAC